MYASSLIVAVRSAAAPHTGSPTSTRSRTTRASTSSSSRKPRSHARTPRTGQSLAPHATRQSRNFASTTGGTMKIVKRMAVLASAIVVTGGLGIAAASSAGASSAHYPAHAAAGHAVASTSSIAAPRAPAFGTVTVWLTNASSFCADVKNSNNHAGATVWLYSCSASHDDKWVEVPASCPLVPSPCFSFQDAQARSLCMDMPVADGYITLQSCSGVTAAWFIAGANEWLADAAWGGGIVATAASTVSGDPLFGEALHNGWQQWNCTGGC
jgi:hypothetical protein